ncbi:uncharacterized protein LOC121739823 [Aricia agestis]|uniref:uncharacterized protein LOC121739823 n=1 Tax=Aricia agestis TaxID=91739 RepID=UPI001C209430|nr:uncharacterized protein LOC121739823 [Aricia agestis]
MTYKRYIFLIFVLIEPSRQCPPQLTASFVRWSGVSPDHAAPVFAYTASGAEESLTGACLAQCRELPDCAAVLVAYNKGTCHGIAAMEETRFLGDSTVVYFKKICTMLPEGCERRWWSVESTPGYYFNSEGPVKKVVVNTTVQQCYDHMLESTEIRFRSAQWVDLSKSSSMFKISDGTLGNCILSGESRVTEPESYRVSNYRTLYVENQCEHDYSNKIDRCSYEEYDNQTLKHVDVTYHNITRIECKSACESESRFVCRGFTFTAKEGSICDLHSEELAAGSWLLRRLPAATYYRRVVCLNISVECTDTDLVVTYTPRAHFSGVLYVPGREGCGARGRGAAPVRLALPLAGDCDVNFAYAISRGPNGVVNRTMAYVMLMIQNNPIIQAGGDRWVRAGCSPGGAKAYTRVDAAVSVQDAGRPSVSENSASAVYEAGAPLAMYVVRAHDATPTAAVSLGELLELRIETTEDNEIEAYHLVASSRHGDSSVLLLDSRGCPAGQVDFPALTRTYVDGAQRLWARFKAFRFPTSHIVRFVLMVRFCDGKCTPAKCSREERNTRGNVTSDFSKDEVAASVTEVPRTAAELWRAECGRAGGGRAPLSLELVVGARDTLSADTLVRADHRAAPEEPATAGVVCMHELLLVALALAWLAVQVLLLVGCCVLVKRYRNLAEMSMHKEYQAFDNGGFDTVSTHRRVHWPDQDIDIVRGN